MSPAEIPEQDSGYSSEIQEQPVTTDQTDYPVPPRKGGFLMTALALVLGLALGGGASYYWFGVQQANKMGSQLAEVQKARETVESDLTKVRAEAKKSEEILHNQALATQKPVAKLQSYKVGKGVLLYWQDESSLKRQYYVYAAKGSKDPLQKVSDQPVADNMLLLKQVGSGTWRYAVAAIDSDKKETAQSEVLILKFPLK